VEKLLKDNNLKVAVATMGRKGSYGLDESNNHYFAPAIQCRVVDTTGAGDAYHAGFLDAWSKGSNLSEAMKFATEVAAAKCQSAGPTVTSEVLSKYTVCKTDTETVIS
jgi:sugar/nucleoside kinase (ribokinase family)